MLYVYGLFGINFSVGALCYALLGMTRELWIALALEAIATMVIMYAGVRRMYSRDHQKQHLPYTSALHVLCISFYTTMVPMLAHQANVPMADGVYAIRILPQFLAIAFMVLMIVAWLGTQYTLEALDVG